MKCPTCQNRHQVRQGMTCSRCGYPFVFNPKQRETFRLTDGLFLSWIRKTSRNGTYYYSRNQLFAVHRTHPVSSRILSFLVASLFAPFAVFLAMENLLLGCSIGTLAASAAWGTWRPQTWRTPQHRFDRWIDQWRDAGKPLEGLVENPVVADEPAEWPEDDLYDYGAERVLVVSSERLVDLLVMNNVHAEQRCVIIAESGYPGYLQSRVRRLLEERDDLPVFLLHDASPYASEMAQRVQHCEWLPLDGHPVTDLGFTPDDFSRVSFARALKRHERQTLPADILPPAMLIAALATGFASGKPFADDLRDGGGQFIWSSDAGEGDFG